MDGTGIGEAYVEALVEVAWEVVRAEGLAGLSLRDLAAKLGMRAPSLYSYFDSKHAIFDAMFAQGAREYLESEAEVATTGDPLRDLQAGMRHFVRFCTEDPVRYQLLFQRTIPGFEPSTESFAISIAGLDALRRRLAGIGITDERSVDLLTAIGAGLTDQQISNDPGGDRWIRLADDAMAMYFDHVSRPKRKSPRRART